MNIEDQTLSISSPSHYKRIGEVLIEHEKLTADDVERILQRQKERGVLFGEAARELDLVSDINLKNVLSEQFGYSYVHDSTQINHLLFAAHSPFGDKAEKLRTLRTQLQLKWLDIGNKMIAVSSVNNEDGASQLLANLAIVLSQLNKKTLLIDANLRNPNQNQLFGIKRKEGLANILANGNGHYELSRVDSLSNLYLLTAGTDAPNPQELLNRQAFTDLLNKLETLFDVILIDTLPASLGHDYLTVVSKAGATLVVAKKDSTLLSDLALLKSQLESTQVQILGSVIQA